VQDPWPLQTEGLSERMELQILNSQLFPSNPALHVHLSGKLQLPAPEQTDELVEEIPQQNKLPVANIEISVSVKIRLKNMTSSIWPPNRFQPPFQ
jgi:hypothetical protein